MIWLTHQSYLCMNILTTHIPVSIMKAGSLVRDIGSAGAISLGCQTVVQGPKIEAVQWSTTVRLNMVSIKHMSRSIHV